MFILDPMYFYIGGNMKADRYNVYPESFDRANKRTPAFINLNHEFATESSVRAFEAYVTYIPSGGTGCMNWMVSSLFLINTKNGNKFIPYS